MHQAQVLRSVVALTAYAPQRELLQESMQKQFVGYFRQPTRITRQLDTLFLVIVSGDFEVDQQSHDPLKVPLLDLSVLHHQRKVNTNPALDEFWAPRLHNVCRDLETGSWAQM